jgi:hypothetical protein
VANDEKSLLPQSVEAYIPEHEADTLHIIMIKVMHHPSWSTKPMDSIPYLTVQHDSDASIADGIERGGIVERSMILD